MSYIQLPSSTYPEVQTYADLPDYSSVNGEIYVVKESTGIWPLRRSAGFYVATQAGWTYLGDFDPAYIKALYLANPDTNNFDDYYKTNLDALIAGGGSGSVTSVGTGTGLTGGPITTTGTISLADTAVSPGTYGDVDEVSVITVDQQGRITSATSTPIVITPAAVNGFDEAAQDAVGGILTDSSKIDFTYNDATPSITATIVADSLVNADINSAAAVAVSKLAAMTANRAVVTDGSGFISPATTTATEIGYVNGVTSAIQTQIDAKEPTFTVLPVAKGGTNSGTALNNNRVMQSSSGVIVEAAAITASRALVSDANGIPVASATTATELGYVSGVTSAIQTQIDAKQASDATLTALAAYNSNGLVTQTAANTFIGRAIVGGTGVVVTNGGGVLGNPTIEAVGLPSGAGSAVIPGSKSSTVTGTVSIDANATYVQIEVIGPGGGGGSGRRGAAATARFGGNGGNGGNLSGPRMFKVSDVGTTTIYYSIGEPGGGGSAQTVNTTSGNAGFGSGNVEVRKTNSTGDMLCFVGGALGGRGGGTASSGNTANSTVFCTELGSNGGTANPTGATNGSDANLAASGGGAGGSISSANAISAATNGGATSFSNGSTYYGAPADSPYGTKGGSGGAASITAAATAGSDGDQFAGYGGGGGGGGASLNGFNSGAGGTGGPGFIRILWW